MVQRGRRAVYEPDAQAFEKPTPTSESEYRRKVRMFEHCWLITLRGRMLQDLPPVYLGEVVSHRLLRYGSGLLHLGLAGSSLALAGRSRTARAALTGQLAFAGLALAGKRRAPIPAAGARVVLRARDLGDRRGAGQLPGARRAGGLGQARGDAVRALVTGAAGFVGSHLTEALLERGHDAVGLDCLTDYYDPALKEENARGFAARAARPRRRPARPRGLRRRLPPRGPAGRAQLRRRLRALPPAQPARDPARARGRGRRGRAASSSPPRARSTATPSATRRPRRPSRGRSRRTGSRSSAAST